MLRARVIIGMGLVLVMHGHACSALAADTPLSRAEIDADFHGQLTTLADRCDGLGLAERARQTRAEWIARAPGRQYLFVRSNDIVREPARSQADLDAKWQTKLTDIRRVYAQRLFELAGRLAAANSATAAYQLLHEVLYFDSTHAEARRVLGLTADGNRPRARQPQVAQTKYDWPRNQWWQIDSPHFQIVTDVGQAEGVELATRLEEFHSLWRQIFFEYWNTPAWLIDRLGARASPAPPERKHQVVLFRDRDEYVRQLTPTEPKIAVTLGYYLKGNKTSYFYWGDASAWSVWFHEAAHQLFQETSDPIRDVGEKWNFWVVEGIAVYLESAVRQDGYFTVGGFDADRLQVLRSRIYSGETPLPLDELCGLGREALQRHPEIRRLYSQAAGITHYFMDQKHSPSRDEFVRKLGEAYHGADSPRTFLQFSSLPGGALTVPELRQFLQVTSADLDYLGPVESRRNLSLAGAKIDDEALRKLAGSTALEWLDLAYTPVTAAGLKNLGPLPSLKQLTLVSTPIADEACQVLAPPALPRLEELDLSGTAITDAGLESLRQITSLTVLRISHTRVTDAGIARLSTLNKLEELDVDQTQVSVEGLHRLKSQLPKLH